MAVSVVKHWKRADWEESGNVFNQICRDLVSAMEHKQSESSQEVQTIIRRHFERLKNFWTPTRASYTGHSHLIADSELRKPYEAFHPQLPDFAASAIRVFAQKELK